LQQGLWTRTNDSKVKLVLRTSVSAYVGVPCSLIVLLLSYRRSRTGEKFCGFCSDDQHRRSAISTIRIARGKKPRAYRQKSAHDTSRARILKGWRTIPSCRCKKPAL
jgi:hypothetical protein